MFAAILPWSPPKERRARVARARRGAEEAQSKLSEARDIKQDLDDILQRNHFAQTIVEGIMHSQQRQGREPS